MTARNGMECFLCGLAICAVSAGIAAAQSAVKPTTTAPPAAAPASPAGQSAADQKSAILNSTRWRRAMFEMNEWLTSQRLYDAKQVEQIKANFSAKVHKMSAEELQYLLADMEAKFQILETPQAQDARAWLGHYLSILSDRKREEVISKLPNFATMNAQQLQQEIARIELKRQGMEQQQSSVARLRDSASNPWNQETQAAEAAYIRDHSMQRSAYTSPYRSGSKDPPFSNVKLGPSMGISTGPFGGAYLSLSF